MQIWRPDWCILLWLQIRSAIELSTSNYDKEKLQERLAKLSGGVAVLKVILTYCQQLVLFCQLTRKKKEDRFCAGRVLLILTGSGGKYCLLLSWITLVKVCCCRLEELVKLKLVRRKTELLLLLMPPRLLWRKALYLVGYFFSLSRDMES